MLASTSEQRDDTEPGKRPGGVTGKGFLPGRSGNPSGLSRDASAAAARLRRMAAAMTEECLVEALSIAKDQKERTADRLRAIELIVRCGHADAVRGESESENKVFVVRPMIVDPQPTPGVLNSPIKGHIALPSMSDPTVADLRGG